MVVTGHANSRSFYVAMHLQGVPGWHMLAEPHQELLGVSRRLTISCSDACVIVKFCWKPRSTSSPCMLANSRSKQLPDWVGTPAHQDRTTHLPVTVYRSHFSLCNVFALQATTSFQSYPHFIQQLPTAGGVTTWVCSSQRSTTAYEVLTVTSLQAPSISSPRPLHSLAAVVSAHPTTRSLGSWLQPPHGHQSKRRKNG